MGLFQFLKGNKSIAKPIYEPSAGFTVTTSFSSYYEDIHQKTRGQLSAIPIEAWDGYISPSGGFINYGCFDIKGKNKETNRKSSRYIEAQTEEEACKRAEEKGLIGPYSISIRPADPPSDSQILYARSLGAKIPDGACSRDVSAIISRITDDDEGPVSQKLAHVAHIHGLKISRYSGRKQIFSLASQLPAAAYRDFIYNR